MGIYKYLGLMNLNLLQGGYCTTNLFIKGFNFIARIRVFITNRYSVFPNGTLGSLTRQQNNSCSSLESIDLTPRFAARVTAGKSSGPELYLFLQHRNDCIKMCD